MKRYVHFRKDIVGIIAIVCGVILVLVLLFLMNTSNNSSSLKKIYEKTTLPLGNIVYIAQNYQRMRVILSSAVIDPSPVNFREQKEKYDNLYDRFQQQEEQYSKALFNDEDKALFEKYLVLKKEFHDFAIRIFGLLQSGRHSEAVLLMKTEGVSRSDNFRDIIEQITRLNIEAAKSIANYYNQSNNLYLMIMIVISITAVLVSTVLAYLGSNSIKTLLMDMKSRIESATSETIGEKTEIKPSVVKIDPENIVLPEQPFDLSGLTDNIVKKTMQKFNGNKTKTAEYLGLSRIQLYRRYK